MTIRDAIESWLAGAGEGLTPADALAEHGLGDLPAEAFSSALLSYAEQAPLDVADALAPIVTRVSPVPFELDDLDALPGSDLDLDPEADVFQLIEQADLTSVLDEAEIDLDRFDSLDDDLEELADGAVAEGRAALDDAADDLDETFGIGTDDVTDQVDQLADEVTELGLDTDDALDTVEDFTGEDAGGLVGDLIDQASDGLGEAAASFTDDLDDLDDPADLDFDA